MVGKGSKEISEKRVSAESRSICGCFPAVPCAPERRADFVEGAEERVDLFVRGVEVWAHAEATARAIIVEELARRELPRHGFRVREVEADRSAARSVVARRVDGEAALFDLGAEERRLAQALRADVGDAEALDRLPSG